MGGTDWFFIIVMGALLVFFLGTVTIWLPMALVAHRKRIEASRAWAHSRGWHYEANDRALVAYLRNLDLEKAGWISHATNVVRGPWGSSFALSAECKYRSAWTYPYELHRHVAGLQLLPERPNIVVKRRTKAQRKRLGSGRPEVLTGDVHFDEVFKIEQADLQTAQALLTPAVRHYCMTMGQLPFAILGQWVFTWTKGRRNLETVEREFHYLDGLVFHIPQGSPPAAQF